ncbi:hypothetical protein Avbf_13675, partial [Armadillidium vulgare]
NIKLEEDQIILRGIIYPEEDYHLYKKENKKSSVKSPTKLYIHPIIPSLTNITNTLLMEGRKK